MRRPTKQQVIAIIKRDHEYGRKKLLDAVTLKDGSIVILYESRRWVPDQGKDMVSRRLLIRSPTGEGNTGTIVGSRWEDPEQPGGKGRDPTEASSRK